MSHSDDQTNNQEHLDTQHAVRPLNESQIEAIVDFARSEVFSQLFKSGMGMVEETASYLDGKGREDSRALPRKIALAYAGESMRLTTRLMQVASWLLVQRAIKEGELTPAEGSQEKYRVSSSSLGSSTPMAGAHLLPEALIDLMRRSENLYERVERLDRSLYVDGPSHGPNQLHEQQQRLEELFGRGGQGGL